MKRRFPCDKNQDQFGKTIGFACAICGSHQDTIRFKNHRICKNCLHYIQKCN